MKITHVRTRQRQMMLPKRASRCIELVMKDPSACVQMKRAKRPGLLAETRADTQGCTKRCNSRGTGRLGWRRTMGQQRKGWAQIQWLPPAKQWQMKQRVAAGSNC